MEFGIIEIESGWFRWYLKDNEKSVEISASRYAEADFVKQFLISLTEVIRDKEEKRFSIFAEPYFVTVNMSVDQSFNFSLELAFEHMSDLPDEDIKKGNLLINCCFFCTIA